MAKNVIDTIVSAIFFIGSIFLWFVADNFPVFEKYKEVDSDMWPKLVLGVIAFLALIILIQNVQSLLKCRKEHRPAEEQCGSREESRQVAKRIIIISLLAIAYFFGLRYMGFILSTILFLYITIFWIGIPGKRTKILYPLLFTTGLALVFIKFLELSLPRGAGIFRMFSELFY